MALHYFVEIDERLNQKAVGSSAASNGVRAIILFARKRYGRDGYEYRVSSGLPHIFANDGRELVLSPFPVI